MTDSWFVLKVFQRQTQAILATFALLFVTNTSLESIKHGLHAPANVCNVTYYTKRERILHDCEKIWILCSSGMFEWQNNILRVPPANEWDYRSCHENIKLISSSQREMFIFVIM